MKILFRTVIVPSICTYKCASTLTDNVLCFHICRQCIGTFNRAIKPVKVLTVKDFTIICISHYFFQTCFSEIGIFFYIRSIFTYPISAPSFFRPAGLLIFKTAVCQQVTCITSAAVYLGQLIVILTVCCCVTCITVFLRSVIFRTI